MNFLYGIIIGMALPVCPEYLYLILLICSIDKFKEKVTGIIIGYILIERALNIPNLTGKSFVATIQQTSPLINNKAIFSLSNKFNNYKISAKSKIDYNNKQANCYITCQKHDNHQNNWQPNSKWYNISQGIIASCKIHKCNKIKSIESFKHDLETKIPNKYKNSDIFKALLLGQSNIIPKEKKNLFKFSGLAHLIAVSGLHIGIIYGIFGYLFGRIWHIFVKYVWQYPKQYFVIFGGSLGAIIYTWLSGFGDSSIRAMTMLLVANLIYILKLSISKENTLFIAMTLILISHPLTMYSIGFWLSISAVWALVNSKQNLFSPHLNMLCIMLPFQAWLSWPIGWWMPICNMVAIPLFSIVIIPGAFLAWLLSILNINIAAIIWLLLDSTLTYFFQALTLLKKQVGVGFVLPITNYWQIIYITISAILFVKNHNKIATLLLLSGYFIFSEKIRPFQVKITSINVGQGLSILVKTQKHTMLVDTGSKYSSQTVLNLLKSKNIVYLDKILISHGDLDHSGGLEEITKNFRYGSIISGEPNRLKQKSTQCKKTTWIWDGVLFSTFQLEKSKKHNNNSCILHIESPKKSILFPGDIDTSAEKKLLEIQHKFVSDILIAAHHGSISSSSQELIKKVNPKTIIVSAGNYNQFKHPAKQLLTEWRKLKIKVINTNNHGSIEA